MSTAHITYLHRYNPLEIQKFLEIRNLESEIITVAQELVNKHGKYFRIDGKRFYFNIDKCTRSEERPQYQIEKLNDNFSITAIPDTSYIKMGLLNDDYHLNIEKDYKKVLRNILKIQNGIIESCLDINDLKNLKTILSLENDNQRKNVLLIAPLVRKILNFNKKTRIVGRNYILENHDEELVIVNIHQVELMRVFFIKNQWRIIHCSIRDSNLYDFQKIKILIDKIEDFPPQKKEKLNLDLLEMI